MYHIFFIHSSLGHLCCFQILVIMMNNVAVNIVEQMPSWYRSAFLGYMLKSGISGSWGWLRPNILRNHPTDFKSRCTSLHTYQICKNVHLTLHILQHKLSLASFILDLLTGLKWYLRIILTCLFLGICTRISRWTNGNESKTLILIHDL